MSPSKNGNLHANNHYIIYILFYLNIVIKSTQQGNVNIMILCLAKVCYYHLFDLFACFDQNIISNFRYYLLTSFVKNLQRRVFGFLHNHYFNHSLVVKIDLNICFTNTWFGICVPAAFQKSF